MKKHTSIVLRSLAALALAAALFPGSVFGQEKRMTVDDLAKSSGVVVVGKVQALKSEWNSDKTRIYTRVTLGVDEYLKGQGQDRSVTIMTLGGEIGDVGELYTHVPSFRENESVVVFLEKAQDGTYSVSGGTQGKYIIENDRATGRPVVAGKSTLEEFRKVVKMAVEK